MNTDYFDPKRILVERIISFLKKHSIRQKVFTCASRYSQDDCPIDRDFFKIGKKHAGDFSGYLVTSNWSLRRLGDCYVGGQASLLQTKEITPDEVPTLFSDNSSGFYEIRSQEHETKMLFRLTYVKNYSRSSCHHWHGISCSANIIGSGSSDERLNIMGDYADRIISHL